MPDDRYPVDPLSGPAGLAEKLRDLQRQLDELKGQPFVGSQMRVLDTDGVTRFLTGNLGDGHYGSIQYNAAGAELTRTDERGIISPPLAVTMSGRGAGTSQPEGVLVTSGTFVNVYQGFVPSFVHQGLTLRLGFASDVGTTGEVRAEIVRVSDLSTIATSNAHTIASGGADTVVLSWLHGVTLPGPGSLVQINARRTGGAGSLQIFRPFGVFFVGPDGMTGSGGAWTT